MLLQLFKIFSALMEPADTVTSTLRCPCREPDEFSSHRVSLRSSLTL
jgi:hypothetical protein